MSKPAESTWSIMRRVMLEHGRPHAKAYTLAFVFMAVVAACTSFSAWIMKDLVNTAFVDGDRGALMYFPLLISGLFFVKGVFSYLQETTIARIGGRIVTEIQLQLYEQLLRMDIAFFHRRSSSDLITRMTNGAQAVQAMINLTAVSLGRDLLTVLGLCTVMILQDPALFLIVLLTAPVAALALRQLAIKAKSATKSETKGMVEILALTRETSQGIRMVKSFQLEGPLKERMGVATRAVQDQRYRMARIKAGVAPLSETLSGIAIAAVILYATVKSQSDPEIIGRFFSFITALLLAGEPMRRLSKLHIDLATAGERVKMLYAIMDEQQVEPKAGNKPPLTVREGNIVFDKVSFTYGGAKPVLNAIKLNVPAGKITAFVGPSGGGKTTVLGLIQGFYQPTAGSVLIDGQSVDQVSLDSLRAQISYLDQDAFLFEGTIEDNIYGSAAPRDPERMIAAAHAADADRFVSALPRGYQTRLRELGTNLSGGQRQRIAIARAFYKNAPILLLDEPTSALDGAAEQQIQSSLLSLAQGKTAIVVAHRLSTIISADVIHVIEHGSVVESGSHAELLANNGKYAELFHKQSGMNQLAATGHLTRRLA